MRRCRTASPEEGSAALEFLVGSVLLIVPLVYLVLALAGLQSAAFATEGAARGAALLVARGDDPGRDERVRQAVDTALADFGVEASGAGVTVACRPEPGCAARDGEVTVTVRVDVPLPLVPDTIPAAVPVEGTATLPLSRFAPAAGETP